MSKAMVELYERYNALADNAQKSLDEAIREGWEYNQGLWLGYRDAYRFAAADLFTWSSPKTQKMILASINKRFDASAESEAA